MENMLNKFAIIGRVVKDPTIYQTKTDAQSVTTLVLATNWKYKKDGQNVEKAIFHNITLWAEQAQNATKWLKKGNLVYIEGKMDNKTSKVTIDGQEVNRTETILVGSRFIKLSPKESNVEEEPNVE